MTEAFHFAFGPMNEYLDVLQTLTLNAPNDQKSEKDKRSSP